MRTAYANAVVRLTHDVPTLWLHCGDVGTVRSVWLSPVDRYEVEFNKPGQAPVRALLATGFCGGFTTFSTFSWQTLEQMQKGAWGAAAANVLLSVGLCLLGAWLGFRLGRT